VFSEAVPGDLSIILGILVNDQLSSILKVSIVDCVDTKVLL
jgi:hypothetical protein